MIKSTNTNHCSDIMDLGEIFLCELSEGTPGITPVFGCCLCEAATICLEDQKHGNGTKLFVEGEFDGEAILKWDPATSQMQRCWGDLGVTTEHGAYGIAILLLIRLTDLTVISRSRKGTGFDFWLGSKENSGPLFQNKGRLEVSGIRKGTKTEIRSRTKQKLEQTNISDGSLPAYASVTEFSEPRSRFVRK